MRLLLDSHVALWWLEDNPRLGHLARRAIVDAEDVVVSAATPWELGIKQALGRLTIPLGMVETLESGGIRSLSITARHAERAAALPAHHRDPFDRMLVAQAGMEALALVTADAAFEPYGIELVPAER